MATRAPRLRLWIPGIAVSCNAMYQRNASGRVFLTKAARDWKAYVAEVVTYEAITGGFPICEHLTAYGGATITYEFHKARGDADNLVKLTQDGIATGLGVNDKLFRLGGVSRVWQERHDRVGVWVTIEATEVAQTVQTANGKPARKKGAA